MSATNEALADDIRYLKSVAMQGGRPFRRDGAILLVTGLVWGLSSLLAWLAVSGTIAVPVGLLRALLYLSLPLIVGGVLLARARFPVRRDLAVSRLMSSAWTGVVVALFVIAIAFVAAAIRLRNPAVWTLVTSAMFALYGTVWWVVFSATRRTAHGLLAFACLAMTVVVGALAGTTALWLAHGLGMLLLVALPGWLLVRGTDDGAALPA